MIEVSKRYSNVFPWASSIREIVRLDDEGLAIYDIDADCVTIPADSEHSPVDVLDDFIKTLTELRADYIKKEKGGA